MNVHICRNIAFLSTFSHNKKREKTLFQGNVPFAFQTILMFHQVWSLTNAAPIRFPTITIELTDAVLSAISCRQNQQVG